jgi:hypothetical protein
VGQEADDQAVAVAAALCDGVRGAARNWPSTSRLAEHAAVLAGGRAPASAPELNPVEGLWSSFNAVELANLTGPTLAEVINQAHQGVRRVRRTPHLACLFLRHTGLSVA